MGMLLDSGWFWVSICLSPFLIYIFARMVFHAYFFTKGQHERQRRNHG